MEVAREAEETPVEVAGSHMWGLVAMEVVVAMLVEVVMV